MGKWPKTTGPRPGHVVAYTGDTPKTCGVTDPWTQKKIILGNSEVIGPNSFRAITAVPTKLREVDLFPHNRMPAVVTPIAKGLFQEGSKNQASLSGH